MWQTATLNLNIPLLPVQQEFLTAVEDFVVIVSSRSCGKTWIAVLDALMEVLKGNNILYMVQNDGSWYKGGWIHLMNFLRKFGLMDRWHWNGQYKIGTIGNSKFYVGTYENVDGARGATECSTLYLDEFMLSKPSIMAALSPCLRGKDQQGNLVNPRIRGVSTPDFMSQWQLMVVEHEKYDIRVLRSKMTENVFISDKQREVMAKAIFDEKLRRQEIDGEIILDAGATSIIDLQCFPHEPAYTSNGLVYGGLDMAHTGQRDSHVFAATQGNRLLALHQFGICGSEEVCSYIRRFHKVHPLSSLNMDLAWSESVFDQLKYEIRCRQVGFGERAPDDQMRQYGNIRAFGYFNLAKRHKEGLCVDMASEWIDPDLVAEYKREMCNTHFTLMRDGRLLIEAKDLIKERIGRSPDPADAMMLTQLDYRDIDAPTIIPANVGGLAKNEIARILDAYDD